MNRLKELRDQIGKLQKEIAQDLNLSVQVYCNYEKGQREPSFDTLIKIAQYFDVSVDYLLGLTDIREPYPRNQTITDEHTPSDIPTPLFIPPTLNQIGIGYNKGIDNLTQEDVDDITKFIEFVKNRRK